MRLAGFDPGERRVGIAISVGNASFPLEVVERIDGWLDRVRQLIDEYGVEKLVVGVPLSLDGGETESTRMAHRFIDELKGVFALPVEEVDERFSSRGVERALSAAGVSMRSQRGRVDDLAAADILQRYLDRLENA